MAEEVNLLYFISKGTKIFSTQSLFGGYPGFYGNSCFRLAAGFISVSIF